MGIVSPYREGDRVLVKGMDPGERWFMAAVIKPHFNGQVTIEREDDKRRGMVANRDCCLSPSTPYGATLRSPT